MTNFCNKNYKIAKMILSSEVEGFHIRIELYTEESYEKKSFQTEEFKEKLNKEPLRCNLAVNLHFQA